MDKNKRLTLAYQNLETILESELTSLPSGAEIIDLTQNKIRDVTFLKHFPLLTSIILDHNKVDHRVFFPYMPSVTLLWLNHNDIEELSPFIENLRRSFPSLKHLCLMGNKIAPPCKEETYYDYLQYRLYVISWFQDLEVLDDRPVTDYEREEAVRLFDRPLSLPSVYNFFRSAIGAFKNIVLNDQAEETSCPSASVII